jgi:hypothetical protein
MVRPPRTMTDEGGTGRAAELASGAARAEGASTLSVRWLGAGPPGGPGRRWHGAQPAAARGTVGSLLAGRSPESPQDKRIHPQLQPMGERDRGQIPAGGAMSSQQAPTRWPAGGAAVSQGEQVTGECLRWAGGQGLLQSAVAVPDEHPVAVVAAVAGQGGPFEQVVEQRPLQARLEFGQDHPPVHQHDQDIRVVARLGAVEDHGDGLVGHDRWLHARHRAGSDLLFFLQPSVQHPQLPVAGGDGLERQASPQSPSRSGSRRRLTQASHVGVTVRSGDCEASTHPRLPSRRAGRSRISSSRGACGPPAHPNAYVQRRAPAPD